MIVCVLIASFVFQQKPSNSIFQNRNPTNILMRTDTVRTLGRPISNLGPISETNFEMPLPNLSKGAYFLIFQSGHLKTVKSIYLF
jgi:hypothetical protein